MSSSGNKSSRRAFFLQGGAVLGAGVASATGAAAMMPGNKSPDIEAETLQECEAIRQVQTAFATMIEAQAYEAASDLFADDARVDLSGVRATGMPAIAQLFSEQYRQLTAPVVHRAYRHANPATDVVEFSADRQQAAATFHVDVALSTPLVGDSTVAKMARLQGQSATRSWETGRLDCRYVKTDGQWKIASVSWQVA